MMKPLMTKNRSTPAPPRGFGSTSYNSGQAGACMMVATITAATARRYWMELSVGFNAIGYAGALIAALPIGVDSTRG